jgi:hypothetical protein
VADDLRAPGLRRAVSPVSGREPSGHEVLRPVRRSPTATTVYREVDMRFLAGEGGGGRQ